MSGNESAFPRTEIETDLMGDGSGNKYPHTYTYGVGNTGLTKRELFAAMAMQGSLGGVPGSHLVPPNLAAMCVEYADALLKALDSSQREGGDSNA